MLAKVMSYGTFGVSGYPITVEVDISNGLPMFDIVGLPDASVREAKERVRSAIRNGGFLLPNARITVNLAPADVRKEGALYDLPIAVGLLAATEQIPSSSLEDSIFVGELSLDGGLRPVNGILSMVIDARERNFSCIVLPEQNGEEAAYLEHIAIYGMGTLSQVVEFLLGDTSVDPLPPKRWQSSPQIEGMVDFQDIRGQAGAKRAMEVAAAGNHNILLIGPPGTGKTMLARGLWGILPQISFMEALEVTKVHSVAGNLDRKMGIINHRPFRNPHHSASTAALTGGGSQARPGEVSLAHYGVLFLDEFPEFRRDALEALRQPVEDGVTTVTRIAATFTYPSDFMLVAAMNPCPCGHYGTDRCRCTPVQVQRYLGRISGPLLSRIDIHMEMGYVSYEHIAGSKKEESSSVVRQRVDAARTIQQTRFSSEGIYSNARMTTSMVREYCALTQEGEALMERAFSNLSLSARGYTRILKLGRTIADLAREEQIQGEHIAEALQYRSLDRKYWGG